MPKVVPEYKEAARKRIIEHAKRLFTEQGYYQTRMTDVAESIGVSKGALYQYFDSKDALLIAVLDSHTKLRGNAVQSYLDAGGLATFASAEFFDRMVSLRMGSSVLITDLLREARENEVIMKWVQKSATKWVKDFVQVIKYSQKEGLIRSDVHPESLVRAILAMRDGLYSSLDVGLSVSKARKAWVAGMGLISESMLVKRRKE
jgi:AcrR family transcriptional regulator